ncbi:MAG: hypothetical protein HY234_03895 [Acidobacteria bacterium]|nr:hypothetical protein [Acidobacteriota bacterium]
MSEREYKVCPKEGGPIIIVPTLEEAVRLVKLLSNGHGSEVKDMVPAPQEDHEAGRVENFFLSINENARTLLSALSKHRNGVRGEQLAKETGFTPDKFGGIFGGASKIAKKFGLRFEKFVVSEIIVKGTERYRFLQPGKLLIENEGKLYQAVEDSMIDVK